MSLSLELFYLKAFEQNLSVQLLCCNSDSVLLSHSLVVLDAQAADSSTSCKLLSRLLHLCSLMNVLMLFTIRRREGAVCQALHAIGTLWSSLVTHSFISLNIITPYFLLKMN